MKTRNMVIEVPDEHLAMMYEDGLSTYAIATAIGASQKGVYYRLTDLAVCPECGYDDCTGDCQHRVPACGPCAWCGDPCEPGRSLCHSCYQAELVEAITEDTRRG